MLWQLPSWSCWLLAADCPAEGSWRCFTRRTLGPGVRLMSVADRSRGRAGMPDAPSAALAAAAAASAEAAASAAAAAPASNSVNVAAVVPPATAEATAGTTAAAAAAAATAASLAAGEPAAIAVAAAAAGGSVAELKAALDPLVLLQQPGGPVVAPLVQAFSFLAIATSFTGFVLAAVDFLPDAFKPLSSVTLAGRYGVPVSLTGAAALGVPAPAGGRLPLRYPKHTTIHARCLRVVSRPPAV